jgi:hypothetical protein
MEPIFHLSPELKPTRGRTRTQPPLHGLHRTSSPLAQELLAEDLSSCVEAEDDDYPTPSTDLSEDVDVSIQGLFLRPTGITFGPTVRPSLAPHDVGSPAPAPNRRERMQSRNAERSLLRDNHLLPPKRARPLADNPFSRLYRYLFSTKVRSIRRVPSTLSEITPLLHDANESLQYVEALRWDVAVATNVIQTTWQREAKTLASYSQSLGLTFILHYSITVASIFAVGRIGKVELGSSQLYVHLAHLLSRHYPLTCFLEMHMLTSMLSGNCHSEHHMLHASTGFSHMSGHTLRAGVWVWPQAPCRPPMPAPDLSHVDVDSTPGYAVVSRRCHPDSAHSRARNRHPSCAVSSDTNPWHAWCGSL